MIKNNGGAYEEKIDYLKSRHNFEYMKENIEEKIPSFELLGIYLMEIEKFDIFTARALARKIRDAISKHYPQIYPNSYLDDGEQIDKDMRIHEAQMELRRKYEKNS